MTKRPKVLFGEKLAGGISLFPIAILLTGTQHAEGFCSSVSLLRPPLRQRAPPSQALLTMTGMSGVESSCSNK
jgi:hypothetical protein